MSCSGRLPARIVGGVRFKPLQVSKATASCHESGGTRTTGQGEGTRAVMRDVTSDTSKELPFTLPNHQVLVEEPPLGALKDKKEKSRWQQSVALTVPVQGQPCRLLLDTGGGRGSYASESWVRQHPEINPYKSDPFTLHGVLGGEVTRSKYCDLTVRFGTFKGHVEEIKVTPLKGYDLILGLNFFDHFVEAFTPDCLTLRDKDRKSVV